MLRSNDGVGDLTGRRAAVIGTGGYLMWSAAPAPAPAAEATTAAPTEPAPEAPANKKPTKTPAKATAKPTGLPSPTETVVTSKAAPGLLTVYSRAPLDLIVDGTRLGSTDDGQLSVPSGRRRIEVVNKRLNYRGEITLDIPAGQVTTHTITLPAGQLHVTGTAGADVFVEGAHVGTLPMNDIAVPLGTREVIVRHPVYGERKQTVEVTYGATTQIALPQGDAAAAPIPATPAEAASRLASPPAVVR